MFDFNAAGASARQDLTMDVGVMRMFGRAFGPFQVIATIVMAILGSFVGDIIGDIIRNKEEKGALRGIVDMTRVLLPDMGIAFAFDVEKLYDLRKEHGFEKVIEMLPGLMYKPDMMTHFSIDPRLDPDDVRDNYFKSSDFVDKTAWPEFSLDGEGNYGSVFAGVPYTDSFKQLEGDELLGYKPDQWGLEFQYKGQYGTEFTYKLPVDFQRMQSEQVIDMFYNDMHNNNLLEHYNKPFVKSDLPRNTWFYVRDTLGKTYDEWKEMTHGSGGGRWSWRDMAYDDGDGDWWNRPLKPEYQQAYDTYLEGYWEEYAAEEEAYNLKNAIEIEKIQQDMYEQSRENVQLMQHRIVDYIKHSEAKGLNNADRLAAGDIWEVESEHFNMTLYPDRVKQLLQGFQNSELGQSTHIDRTDIDGNPIPLELYMASYMNTQFITKAEFEEQLAELAAMGMNGMPLGGVEYVTVNGEQHVRGYFKDYDKTLKEYNSLLWSVSDWSTDEYENYQIDDSMTQDQVFDKHSSIINKYNKESTEYDAEYADDMIQDEQDRVQEEQDKEIKLNKMANNSMYRSQTQKKSDTGNQSISGVGKGFGGAGGGGGGGGI